MTKKFNIEEVGENKGKFDIKTRALMPLIDGARLLVLNLNIKGINNTVADAISQLEYDPKQNLTNEYTHATLQVPMGEPTATRKWTTFSKHWQEYKECSTTLNTSNF